MTAGVELIRIFELTWAKALVLPEFPGPRLRGDDAPFPGRARAGVAKPKWSERVEVVNELPTTPSGKVQKFRLREIIAERTAAGDSGPRRTSAGA